MSPHLREELARLADTQPAFHPDPALWDLGRRARRRSRVIAGAAALAVVAVIGGLGALSLRSDDVGPADGEVPGGAIPSRIEDPGGRGVNLEPESDLAIGPASVAFVSASGDVTVVGATDGTYHVLDLPNLPVDRGPVALSPDGRRLAWRSPDRIHHADLRTGEVVDFTPLYGSGAEVHHLAWGPDSTSIMWRGDSEGDTFHGLIDITGPSEQVSERRPWFGTGLPSPDRDLAALATPNSAAKAVRFLRSRNAPQVLRPLPEDLYPQGAAVTPVGWADDRLLVAQVWADEGSYAEGQHLVLFTSPARPPSEWTYRFLVRDMQLSAPLSVAVDLIPDLDGTSHQVLTHDFGQEPGDTSPWRERAPYALGALMSLLAGLAFVRMLRHQA